ncbi:Protoporphyrinogen oxidase [Mariprofundus ferrinatatus]|uniref:Protoporphyrinogen oxidase n=1 Tax=Mariprofundus ferrinatatus TaxID=1921087 RepID=A0A2K8L3N7_9PROT|nr:FAD-dependent oxidoreductase [Mariprofundus ferrinatatus]ATX81945.1 Protoporphyrinogen oxidase [Mariprofundus ferrinatatus]
MRAWLPKKACRSSWSSKIQGKQVAVIGAGLCGLTAAIRLAESGVAVTLFEAAPQPGGRTRSFIDKTTGELCDNGPHLLTGAYEATQKLLSDCGAAKHVTWQSSLELPLWDNKRDRFILRPAPWMPLSLALLVAIKGVPGHGWSSALAMLRLASALKREDHGLKSVADLISHCNIPSLLVTDMLEPICLGTMNEGLATANAATFKRVLRECFASHKAARLGWFNDPLQQALIEPLATRALQLGVIIRTGCRIHRVKDQGESLLVDEMMFDAAVIALPSYAAANLFENERICETHCITNIHLWYENHVGLPEPLIGGIGTTGQWFFDISAQMGQQGSSSRHLCAVISADELDIGDKELVALINREIGQITGEQQQPFHHRIVREKRATVLVRDNQSRYESKRIIDATEAPGPGDLPATIEFAVQRGDKAASDTLKAL